MGDEVDLAALHEAGAEFRQMPWSQFLGIEMTEAEPGRATLRIDPKPEHHNQNLTVNAPVMFGLAEAAGAAVVVLGFLDRLGMTYTVVRHVEMHFLAAARGPIEATGTVDPAEVERVRAQVEAGEAVDLPVPVEVRTEDGRVVARIDMVLAVRSKRPDT